MSNSRTYHPSEAAKKKHLKKGVLFTGKYMCQSLFFNKVAGLRPATLLKKRLWHRCFPVNFAKFIRTPFLQNTSSSCFWPFSLSRKWVSYRLTLTLIESLRFLCSNFNSRSACHNYSTSVIGNRIHRLPFWGYFLHSV